MKTVNKIVGTFYFLRVNRYCYKTQCSNSTFFLLLNFRLYVESILNSRRLNNDSVAFA